MAVDRKPNCAGYTLYRLGLADSDRYADPDATVNLYFTNADGAPAEAAAVIVRDPWVGREYVFHLVPFNPGIPNSVDHRPNPGEPIIEKDTFYNAIGHYVDDYLCDRARVVFLRRK